jgi:hypothetical protein
MDKWWAGMNFSIGSQAFHADKKDILEKIRVFLLEIKKPKDLKNTHTELYNEIKEFEESWDDKIEDDENLPEALGKFYGWYQQLKDPKSKFELLKKALESRMQLMEGQTGSWGRTYNSEHQKYYPEEHGKKLSKAGSWIMIVPERIPVEHSPEQYTIYYAKPDPLSQEMEVEFAETFKVPYYRVRITTDHGDLNLWPHEYVMINDIREIMSEVGTNYELKRLGGGANYDSSKVHYLGTRGIGQADVYDMLLGAVNSTTFCYFKLTNPETREYYTFFFDCMDRGISPNMVGRLWECKKTGKPLFKVKYQLNGKEVTEDEFKAHTSKDKQESNPSEDQPTG